MKILINCVRLLPLNKGAGGAGSYLYSLLRNLALLADVRVIAHPKGHKSLSAIPGIQIIPVLTEEPSFFAGHAEWADIYYDPLNGLKPTLLDTRLPVVCCIHDLQHNVYPHYFPQGAFADRNRDYGFAIARADSLIAISEFEKSNFNRFFGKKSVHVVEHGGYLAEHYDAEKTAELKAAGRIPDNYVLFPAVPWRHKNHFRLVEAMSMLRRHINPQDAPRLVLTGALEHSGRSKALFEQLIGSQPENGGVEVRGFVDNIEMAALFKNAKALVFPSLYEGFGIPLVEAMQLGVPVLTSRMTAAPEVCGDAAAYFRDPLNVCKMAEDIDALLKDAVRLDELKIAGLARGARYSSERMAQETIAAFEKTRRMALDGSPVELITARPPLDQCMPTEKITVAVDCDTFDPAKDEPEAYIADIVRRLGESLPGNLRLAFLLPENGGLDVIRALNEAAAARGSVVFYPGSDKRRLTLAVRFLIDSILETRYLLFTKASGMPPKAARGYRDAIALLEYHPDLGAAEFLSGVASYGGIRRPLDKKAMFKAFLKTRNDPLSCFANMLLKRSLFEQSDSLGTIRFLSYFLKNVSTVVMPAEDA